MIQDRIKAIVSELVKDGWTLVCSYTDKRGFLNVTLRHGAAIIVMSARVALTTPV